MRRAGHLLAIALITAGLFVIAVVGLTPTEIEAGHSSRADLQALARVRNERREIAILAERFAARTDTGDPIGRIVAPSMDDLSMVVVQGTDRESLQKGPGHFPETSFPGQGDTVGIAGHRTTYLAPFRHIDSVEKGDRIYLEMPYAKFTYEVQKTKIVAPTDVWVVRAVGYERLVLSACHPLYSAKQRYIVFARLIRKKLAGGV